MWHTNSVDEIKAYINTDQLCCNMNVSVDTGELKDLLSDVSVPVIISTVLIGWFYLIQNGGGIIGILDAEYIAGNFQYGVYRTLSHLTVKHLLSNVIFVVVFSLYLLSHVPKKTLFIQTTILFILCSWMVGFLELNVAGFSGVAFGLYGVWIIFTIPVIYNCLFNNRIPRKTRILLFVATASTLIILINVYIDVLILFDLETGISAISDTVDNLPDTYGVKSSKAHLFGFASGLVIGLISVIVSHYRDR